jgi:hypothetical protein
LINNNVKINARKFDGKIHRSWDCRLSEKKDSLLVFVGEFLDKIVHPQLGVIRPGTISYEYYWLDRWYNVFRFHEPEGDLRNFYCNVNLPPVFENGVLDYIDLDIDVLVWKDFSFEVLDREEFETNAARFNYPGDVKEKAHSSLNEIIEMVKTRQFPFDFVNLQP